MKLLMIPLSKKENIAILAWVTGNVLRAVNTILLHEVIAGNVTKLKMEQGNHWLQKDLMELIAMHGLMIGSV